jgi:hypothetical protein
VGNAPLVFLQQANLPQCQVGASGDGHLSQLAVSLGLLAAAKKIHADGESRAPEDVGVEARHAAVSSAGSSKKRPAMEALIGAAVDVRGMPAPVDRALQRRSVDEAKEASGRAADPTALEVEQDPVNLCSRGERETACVFLGSANTLEKLARLEFG